MILSARPRELTVLGLSGSTSNLQMNQMLSQAAACQCHLELLELLGAKIDDGDQSALDTACSEP